MASAPSPDAVLHLAALHTLAAAGFASTSRAASLTLSETLSRYLRLVALACTEKANLAGRSKVSALDVVEGLEELGVGGVGELHEWAVGMDQEVHLTAPGLSHLGDSLKEGLGMDEVIAEMRLVHNEEMPEDSGEESEADGEDEEDSMEVDQVDVKDRVREYRLRQGSPDMSWLPPLPGGVEPSHQQTSQSTAPDHPHPDLAPAASLSIIDRYRRRIPYAQSQLSSSRAFDPPPDPPLPPLPTGTSSFPALQEAFKATAGEPSVTLRQVPLRQQATELLRRTIASPHSYSPAATLVSSLPAPRSTPIIPSHSDTVAARYIALNPDPTEGLLSSLVHQIHSPHLPPTLRERFTSIRPPRPLSKDNEMQLYGEPVRGPSTAALARARGKPTDAETADEGWSRATWPVPSRGADKFTKGKLPGGKKVVQSGIGEDKPRRPEGATDPMQQQQQQQQQQQSKIKLKLPNAGDGAVSPAAQGISPGSGLRLKLGGGPRRESEEPHANGISGEPTRTPTNPTVSLRLNTASISPKKEPGLSPFDAPQPGTSPRLNGYAPQLHVNGHVEGQNQANGQSSQTPMI